MKWILPVAFVPTAAVNAVACEKTEEETGDKLYTSFMTTRDVSVAG